MNGTVDASERDGATICESTHTGSLRQGNRGENPGIREVGKYSYRLVHAQESIRMLDLRLDISELATVTDLGELLAGFVRVVLEEAVLEEVEYINSQVRYKDS